MKTDKRQGRQADDRRSLAHAYFLAISDLPTKEGDTNKKPSIRSRIDGLGLPMRTAYQYWKSVKESQKLVLEGKMDQVVYSSIVT